MLLPDNVKPGDTIYWQSTDGLYEVTFEYFVNNPEDIKGLVSCYIGSMGFYLPPSELFTKDELGDLNEN